MAAGLVEGEFAGHLALVQRGVHFLQFGFRLRPVIQRGLQVGRNLWHGHGTAKVAADYQQLAVSSLVLIGSEFHVRVSSGSVDMRWPQHGLRPTLYVAVYRTAAPGVQPFAAVR